MNYVPVWSVESGLPNDSECPSMEVTFHTEHDSLPLFDTLLLIGPLTRELDGRLYSFCTGVHRQYHVIFKERRYLLGERPEA